MRSWVLTSIGVSVVLFIGFPLAGKYYTNCVEIMGPGHQGFGVRILDWDGFKTLSLFLIGNILVWGGGFWIIGKGWDDHRTLTGESIGIGALLFLCVFMMGNFFPPPFKFMRDGEMGPWFYWAMHATLILLPTLIGLIHIFYSRKFMREEITDLQFDRATRALTFWSFIVGGGYLGTAGIMIYSQIWDDLGVDIEFYRALLAGVGSFMMVAILWFWVLALGDWYTVRERRLQRPQMERPGGVIVTVVQRVFRIRR